MCQWDFEPALFKFCVFFIVMPLRLFMPLLIVYGSCAHSIDTAVLNAVYTNTFRLRDGSTLASADSIALEAMRGNLQRLLAAGQVDLLNFTRSLPDERLLGILLLAVAGNFTVDQSPSALQQRCSIVVDPGTGALVLRDNSATQSVILEVLLIVSIVVLLRAWGERKG